MFRNQLKVLPGYIPPFQSELFSSWFLRLSRSHFLKSRSFSQVYLNSLPIWNRDIDYSPQPELLEFFTAHTPLSTSQFQSLFLSSYRGKLWNGSPGSGRNNAILPIGIYHRIRTIKGIMCCPLCLQKKDKFYKKQWRLFSSIACVECSCLLIDKCPFCLSPIEFHRLENGQKSSILELSLCTCSCCFNNLNTNVTKLSASSIEMEYQHYIDETIKKGYNNVSNYSFSYFNVLNYLVKQFMTSSKKWSRIKQALFNYYNTELPENNVRIWNYDLDLRKQLLPLAYITLKDFPINFRSVFSSSNVRYSDFSKNMKEIPFWLAHELKFIN